MKQMTNYDSFLKTFFELELTWLADRNYQIQSWTNAQGDKWATCIMLYSEAWSTISEHRRKFSLSEHHLKMFERLYEMIRAFERAIPAFPERPSDYRALLNNTDWKKIQQYAKEIYDRIYPTLC